MAVWELGMILVAVGIIIIAIGYNFTLAGYSRKKMMEGLSFHDQMYSRRLIGKNIMTAGGIVVAVSVLVVFVVAGLFMPVKTAETIPKEIDILVAQNKTIVIADGKTYIIEEAHYNIGRVYLVSGLNTYGVVTSETIAIDSGDMWERTELWNQ